MNNPCYSPSVSGCCSAWREQRPWPAEAAPLIGRTPGHADLFQGPNAYAGEVLEITKRPRGHHRLVCAGETKRAGPRLHRVCPARGAAESGLPACRSTGRTAFWEVPPTPSGDWSRAELGTFQMRAGLPPAGVAGAAFGHEIRSSGPLPEAGGGGRDAGQPSLAQALVEPAARMPHPALARGWPPCTRRWSRAIWMTRRSPCASVAWSCEGRVSCSSPLGRAICFP